MSEFLYSCAAKDIQNYILKSDKLVEMVGASELIDKLCREDGFLQSCIDGLGIKKDQYDFITQAAGWAKIKFKDESAALILCKYWPLAVSLYAPGLHIVQDLTPVNGSLSAAITKSEKQLIYARNTLTVDFPEIGPLIDRNPRTGLAAIGLQDNMPIDSESKRKRDIKAINLIKRMTGETNDDTWPKDIKYISGSDRKYIAIIHADGNDLGKILLAIQEYLDENPSADALNIYKGFSKAIEDATIEAVREAYEQVILKDFNNRKAAYKAGRLIVLGGDDVTLIIRADLAFAFTNVFLSKFEETSMTSMQNRLETFNIPKLPERLTACAGIAFVKQAYPFSRAYELAESLCKDAKTAAKAKITQNNDNVPSCFSFCKISTSIAGDYQTIKEKELTARDGSTKLWFGPYSVGTQSKGLPKYDDLTALSNTLKNIPSGSIRELITTMYTDITKAQNDYKRMLQVLRRKKETAAHADELEKNLKEFIGQTHGLTSGDNRTPILDAHRYLELQK